MSKLKETQAPEQSGMNVEKTTNLNSSSELVKQEEIEGTPFKWITMDGVGTFLGFGSYRITEPVDVKGREHKLLETQLKGQNWEIMMSVISAITNQTVMTYLVEMQEKINKANEANKGAKEVKNGN